MSDEKNGEAAELAKKAAREARAAAKDAGRAAKIVAEPALDAAAEEAQDTARKFEATAEDAVSAARRINPWVLSRISSDTGIGFFALSVSIYAGAIAVNKFRQAAAGRTALMTRPID